MKKTTIYLMICTGVLCLVSFSSVAAERNSVKSIVPLYGLLLLHSERSGQEKPIVPNITAPTEDHKWMRGDFSDTDGDGMTDAAEIEYGFNPYDVNSFPIEQPEVIPTTIVVNGSEIGATIQISSRIGIVIKWENSETATYSLTLYNGSQQLYYGGHYSEYAEVNYNEFGLDGTETLTGHFTEHDKESKDPPSGKNEFSIDLSTIPVFTSIGDSNNKISYTFDGFSSEAEKVYREFLKKVWPIMYKRLGPPAETFNTVITNMGRDSDFFMIVDNGRTFKSDTSFVPRLIIHEFVHAWKGAFAITNNDNWNYDPSLSGFEEGSAEGMAFEIVHEYVRAYPTDYATQDLLSYRPHQYQSRYSNHLDTVSHQRNTGSGKFWIHKGSQSYRYATASVTFQTIVKEYPEFYKNMMQAIYNRINTDQSWRPTRQRIIDIWKTIAPTVQGIPLDSYLSALPVFQGGKLDEGLYIVNAIRHYGKTGDQQFAIVYAHKDGKTWWGIKEENIKDYNLPTWFSYVLGDHGYYYLDVQNQPFVAEIYTGNNVLLNSYSFVTEYDRDPDGTPTGFGWIELDELAMEKWPLGLYKEKITFGNYIPFDNGASEDFYFFGTQGYNYAKDDFVIMVGVDSSMSDGVVSINIENKKYTENIVNSAAVFSSSSWPLDLEGVFTIQVRQGGKTCQYKRTLIESTTYHGYKQYGFVIKDTNFNCIEDYYE